MKTRATGLVIIILVSIVMICLSAYALTRPSAIKKAVAATSTNVASETQISAATQSAQDIIQQTASVATMTSFAFDSQLATATQSAQNDMNLTATADSISSTAVSLASTQTQVALPPTLTAVPTRSSCKATLARNNQPIYEGPSDSLPTTIMLNKGNDLVVSAKLDDSDWYQVQSGSEAGWLPATSLQDFDKNCPTLYKVANVFSLQGVTVVDDTFREAQGWYYVNDPQQRPERFRGQYNDYQLIVDGYFAETGISIKALENVPTFDLVTSYYRQNAGNQSYVGISFGDANSSFVVYIFGDCSIEVKNNLGYDEKQPSSSGSNSCRDSSSDYLRITWDGNSVRVWINDTENFSTFLLGSLFPKTQQISLINNGTRVQFNFIAVTRP